MTTETAGLNGDDTVTCYSSTYDSDPSAISLQKLPSTFMRERFHRESPFEHPNSSKRHHRCQCPYIDHEGESSLINVTFNMLNAIIGTGILGVPYIYKSGGILGCIILMLLFAICVTYTLNILIITGKKVQVYNYEVLTEECFGLLGYTLCCLCIVILNFGGMITFLIIINDALLQLLLIFNLESYGIIAMLLLSIFIVFPPCLFRDLSALEKVSLVKMLSIFLIILVVFLEFAQICWTKGTFLGGAASGTQYTLYFGDTNKIPNIIGIVAFSLVCHDSSFLLYQTMKNPTQKRWFTLSVSGIFGAAGFILLLSIPCYLTFGNVIDCNMLLNYEIKAPLIIMMRIVFIITLSLTYPSAFFLVRHILYSSLQKIYAIYKHGYENTKKLKRIMQHKKRRCAKMKRLQQLNINTNQSQFDGGNIDGLEEEELDERIEKLYIVMNEIYTVQSAPLTHHLLLTFLIFGANLVAGLYLKDLGVVMGVIGSLSSVNLAFVFPCLCYLQTYNWREIMEAKTVADKCALFMYTLPSIVLTIVGIFLAIYGVISSVS